MCVVRSVAQTGRVPCGPLLSVPRPCEAMEAIDLGLKPGEIVLRGGMLPGPTVVPGVKTVNGCGFVYLWKTSRFLNAFLAGKMSADRPLSCTDVPEALQELRELRRHELLRGEGADSASGETSGKVDPTAALGFDAPAPAEALPEKRSRRHRPSAKALLPATVLVTLKKDGFEPWSVRLLLEHAQKAVALEVSVSNLTALYLRVQADLAAGRKKRARNGAVKGGAEAIAGSPRRKPRHYGDGSKEYSVRNRWVRKFPAGSAEVPPDFARPGWKRVRVLKRRHTEERDGPVRRGGVLGLLARGGVARGPASSACAAPASNPDSEAEASDPLGVS